MKKNIGICDIPNKDIYSVIQLVIQQAKAENAHDISVFTKGYTKFPSVCGNFGFPEMSSFSGLMLTFVVEDIQTILKKQQDIKPALIYIGQQMNIPLLMTLLNRDMVILTGSEGHTNDIERLTGTKPNNVEQFIKEFLT